MAVGIAIAERQKADIVLLHVVDRFANLQRTEVFLPEIQLMPDINLMIEIRLKEFSESVSKKTGIKVESKVLNGQPFERICRLAYEENISLIVIGTHGTSGLRGLFMGSEAYRVVKSAPCPVLTVPGKWNKKEFKKVLFPIRLIPGALDKYFYARPIIEKNNSELFLLGLTDMKNTRNTKDLMLLIKNLKRQLNNDNVKFQTAYCLGEDFPAEVSKTTRDLNIDLIILTANIDPEWRSYFIGPFGQQVINHAQVPVLSIKPSNDQAEPVHAFRLAEQWGRSINLSGKEKRTGK
ncbi:MAG: universal stress protein [Bacteroidales bacterium]|nr:universal stress protein [Bacteroidales bacterium]